MRINNITFGKHHDEVQNEIIRKTQMVQKGKKCLQRSDAFIKTGVGCNKKGFKVNG